MSQPRRILIVHGDEPVRALLHSMLKGLDHRLDEATSTLEAQRKLETSPIELVIADYNLRDDRGSVGSLGFLAEFRRARPSLPILLLSPEARFDRTRHALNRGANGVLRYPMPATQLRAAVSQALEQAPASPKFSETVQEPGPATTRVEATPPADGRIDFGIRPTDRSPSGELIGDDRVLIEALERADGLATFKAPILIVGERGTGKRQLARRIHRGGPRASGPFLEVSCVGISASEVLADLQGTGERPGKVARAAGGTLYVDDVSSLGPGPQAKLLQLIRDGEFEPGDGSGRSPCDCRLIVGSREGLESLADAGQLRPDLACALGVVTLRLPPLRSRGGDVTRLAETFAARSAAESGGPPPRFDAEAVARLEAHDWPGNVLELRIVVERAVLLSRGGVIEARHLQFAGAKPPATSPARALESPSRFDAPPARIRPLKVALEEPEKRLILEALRALDWNRQETSRVLDINRTTLYKKMKKYGLLYDEPVWAN